VNENTLQLHHQFTPASFPFHPLHHSSHKNHLALLIANYLLFYNREQTFEGKEIFVNNIKTLGTENALKLPSRLLLALQKRRGLVVMTSMPMANFNLTNRQLEHNY